MKTVEDSDERRKSRITMEGYEVLCGYTKPIGNGAHVYLPVSWLGRKVYVVRVS